MMFQKMDHLAVCFSVIRAALKGATGLRVGFNGGELQSSAALFEEEGEWRERITHADPFHMVGWLRFGTRVGFDSRDFSPRADHIAVSALVGLHHEGPFATTLGIPEDGVRRSEVVFGNIAPRPIERHKRAVVGHARVDEIRMAEVHVMVTATSARFFVAG